jgi:CheY-like chemotaxis protein
MKKILIVDDQPEVRELVSVTLEVGGYELLTARNGAEALRVAQSELPDLVLLDVMMPDGPDGLEVCRQIKTDARTQHMTVVLLTARGQEWDIDAGYAAGADDYFVKPFSPLALIEKVEQVLG